MIDLPTNAEVRCSDGDAGRSTYIVGNPVNHRITHLVVKSNWPPFHEYLVPVDQVEETFPDRIELKCTRDDVNKMERFEYDEYIRIENPDHLSWPYVLPPEGILPEEVITYILIKRQNIPQGESVVQRGVSVEATDGYVGQVDDLLIDSNNMQVTHLVLLERHVFEKKEITIPVSQIDHIDEETIYLKLRRQSVEELPTTPIQRWTR